MRLGAWSGVMLRLPVASMMSAVGCACSVRLFKGDWLVCRASRAQMLLKGKGTVCDAKAAPYQYQRGCQLSWWAR